MKQRVVRLLMCAAILAFGSAAAYAQGGVTSSIAGTVYDASGERFPARPSW